MTGIRATLESCYDIISWSQDINNFTFSFIAPLEAENNIYFFHLKLKLTNSTQR